MLATLGKKIIVKSIEVKAGDLILTHAKPLQYQVLVVGDEVTRVKHGDIVYLDNYHGALLEHEKEKLLVIEESAILARVD